MSRSLVASVFGFALSLAVDTSSTFAWEGALNGGGASVTIDPGGDVIAAGEGGPGPSLRVVKYAGATGAKLWEQYFPDSSPSNFRYGFDPASTRHMLAQDAAGDLLLAGAGGPPFGTLLKLAGGTGAVLWRRDVSGPYSCYMRAITVDGAGNPVAAGDVAAAGACDFIVMKVAGSDGTELWRYTLDGAVHNYDSATALGMNAAGDVFAAGFLVNQQAPFRPDITVVKLAGTNGSELWRQVVSGADPSKGSDPVYGPTLAVDPVGDVVVGGSTDCSSGICVFTVTKLAGTNGAQEWQYYLGSRGAVWTVAVDASGDVIAGGDTLGVLNTVKLSGATGAELWRTNAGGTGALVVDAVVDAAGNVVVAGGEGTPFFVAKLAGTSGLPIWTQTVGNGFNGTGTGDAVSVAIAGNSIAATGIVQSPAGRDFAVVDFGGGLTGKRILVWDKAGDPSARRLAAQSKDPRILAGASGTPPDPTVSGATLTLANPTTGETVALPLPASNWSHARLRIAGFEKYNYSDPVLAAGPCYSVVLASSKQTKVRCKGSQLGFSLDEPAQGSLDLRLTIGSAFEYCMRFGGTVRHDAPATSSRAGIFDAVDAPAPACPNGPP